MVDGGPTSGEGVEQGTGRDGDHITAEEIKMKDDDYDIRDYVISGSCDVCECDQINVTYQRDSDEWVCAYCVENEL